MFVEICKEKLYLNRKIVQHEKKNWRQKAISK